MCYSRCVLNTFVHGDIFSASLFSFTASIVIQRTIISTVCAKPANQAPHCLVVTVDMPTKSVEFIAFKKGPCTAGATSVLLCLAEDHVFALWLA